VIVTFPGTAEQVEVRGRGVWWAFFARAPQNAWVHASSCLAFQRQEQRPNGDIFFSGTLVHSLPEHPEATHIIRAPREVLERILEVVPTLEGVAAVLPPPGDGGGEEGQRAGSGAET